MIIMNDRKWGNVAFLVLVVLLGVIAGLTAGWAIGCWRGVAEDEDWEVERKTVVDTVPYQMPVARDSVVVRYKTVKGVVTPGKAMGKGVPGDMEGRTGDSVEVVVPIEQKVYKDSGYTAWVSGYDVRMDSIYVYPKREIVKWKVREKAKKWHVGVTTGYGFGGTGAGPYVGIGLTYSLISF